jgi:crotonobetainyl-CoA:carnitine CoA-transferase CaiB-like acyl-CoA transferase
VFQDPQVKARGMRRTLVHPEAGQLTVVANPVRMASCDTTAQKAPPLLGEDTTTVLREVLGLGAAEIEELRARKVV